MNDADAVLRAGDPTGQLDDVLALPDHLRDALWRVESARLPLKVDDLDLRSRTDGADDLAISFKVSTIWVTPGEPTGKGPGARPAPARPPARAAEDL